MFVKVTVAYDFRITKKYLLSLDPYFVVNNSYCRTYSREEQFLKQAYLLLLLEDTTSQISSLVQIYIVFSIYFICTYNSPQRAVPFWAKQIYNNGFLVFFLSTI